MAMNETTRAAGYEVAARYEKARQELEAARADRKAWARDAVEGASTLQEVADVLGVSYGTVQVILGRKRNASPKRNAAEMRERKDKT